MSILRKYSVFAAFFVVMAGFVAVASRAQETGPLQLAQAAQPVKPQLKITEGETEPGKLKIFPSDAPKLKPVTPANRRKSGQSDAAKTWEIISDSRDPAVLDRFIAKYPGTIQAALAAQKKGQLARGTPDVEPDPIDRIGTTITEPEIEAKPEPTTAPEIETSKSPRELAREIQVQLNKVGCTAGRPDGKWGRQSTRAALQFKQYSGVDVETDRPNADLLSWLKLQSGPVCPISCGAKQQSVNGQCVAKTCPAGQRLSSKGQCYRVKTVKRCKAGQKLSSKGRCYTPRVKKAKKTSPAQACRRGERLNSRGVCARIKKKVQNSSRPAPKEKKFCRWCENNSGETKYICGRKNVRRASVSAICS